MNNKTVWEVYMKSYDKLLLSLHTYNELLDDIYLHTLMQVRKMKHRTINILEVGCGTGNILRQLDGLRNTFQGKHINLTGIDRSSFALKTAADKLKGLCKLFSCDLGKAGLGISAAHYAEFSRNPYDVIIINNVIFTLSDNEKALLFDEIKAIMSEQAVLILSEPHAGATLSNILRAEFSFYGKRGVLNRLFKKKILWHLIKVVLINAVHLSRNAFQSIVQQKDFMHYCGFLPIVLQYEAYGGNNVIFIYILKRKWSVHRELQIK